MLGSDVSCPFKMVPELRGKNSLVDSGYTRHGSWGSLFRCTRADAEGDFVVVVEGLFLICFFADLFKEI